MTLLIGSKTEHFKRKITFAVKLFYLVEFRSVEFEKYLKTLHMFENILCNTGIREKISLRNVDFHRMIFHGNNM